MLKDNMDRFNQMIIDKHIPFSVIWELTYRCNHKCVHCFQYPPGDELDLEKIKDILLQLERHGCLYVSFTGGEPLLREDFWQIAEFARERNFVIDLLTNGSLINKEIAKRLSDLNFGSVHITVLGVTEKTHDEISQTKGSFKRVMQAIEYLKEEGVRIILKTPLMKNNFCELEELKYLEERLFVHYHVISPVIFPKSDRNTTPLSLRLTDKQIEQFYNGFYKRFEDLSQELKEQNQSTLHCYYGRTFCCINPKGEVYPCVAAPAVVGDLRKESFDDIWERSSAFKYLRETRLEDLTECRDCGYAKFCFRCGGLAYLEGESFRAKSPEACRLAKIHKQVRERKSYEREKEKVC